MSRAKTVLWAVLGTIVVSLMAYEARFFLGYSRQVIPVVGPPSPQSVETPPSTKPIVQPEEQPAPQQPPPTMMPDTPLSHHPVTIVSGLWNVKSKRPFSTYKAWAANFLSLDAHMVLFIDPSIRDQIEPLRPAQYRNRTVWINTTLAQFWTYQRYRSVFQEQWKTDYEHSYHTPELYMIWAEKAPMLKRAIALNPFNSSCFYWTDFGCFRGNPQKYLHWPGSERCLEDPRVIILKIRDFSQDEIERFRRLDIQSSLFHGFTVGGGILGGRWDYVLKYHDAYFAMVDRWVAKGLFVGKDQNVMACVAYNHPDLVNLIGPSKTNQWFYLEDYLLPQS